MLGVSLTSRKQEPPPSHQVFIGFLMPRFSGQDWIYLSTAMGFEAGINSEKSYSLRVTREFCLFQDKNLLNLNVSLTGILIEKQDQATREEKKVTGQLLIYTKSQDMHIILSCEYSFIHATK